MASWHGIQILSFCLLVAHHTSAATTPSAAHNGTQASTCAPNLIQQRSRLSRSHDAHLAVECALGSHCVVPSGETWLMSASVNFETLTIRGTLEWDVSKDDLELRAGFVLVESGGHLKIGTQEAPMERKATVYITKNSNVHQTLGKRFLGGVGSGKVDIHGRTLGRTWTLLTSTGFPGTTELQLKDDPATMGWRVGDRIGVATTSQGESTVHRITSLGAYKVTLDSPLMHEHWGGFREIEGHRFEMAAEVVNMERSVVITGDHDDFEESLEGLHTIMTGTGYMDMRYARVEWCGQRPIMGRYCLHFHLMKKCPLCVFQGNAVVEGQHVGITIHGTHQTLVDQNVVWDVRANGLYTEDGNEMDNTLSRNVMICTDYRKCKVDWVSGLAIQTAGIFLIGMSNNIVENRIIQYENGIWTPGSFRGDGRGAAAGKICPQFAPFGEWRGNVCHDNARFGLYLDNQYPRNLERDADGYVLNNRESCKWFKADGRDNGVVNEIRDEFNWHNVFVGQYAIGDIQFVNYTSVNNGHAMYWKQAKNFVDGRMWHMVDSTFAHDPNDRFGVLQFLGPSGPFTFGLKNCKFLGSGPPGIATIAAGQNCGQGGGAGPCTVHYVFDNVDFSRMRSNQKLIQFGAHTSGGQAAEQSMFVALDGSLGGYRSIVSGHLDGFRQAGCVQLGWEWADALGCDRLVRRLNVWGPDVGQLKLSGLGYQVAENWAFPVEGRNAGFLSYDSLHGGYGTPVLVGESYTLTGNFHSDMIVEFSDAGLADYFGAAESVQLNVGGQSCEVKSSDDRSFICPMGRSGGDCVLCGGCAFRTFDRHTRIQGGRLVCGDPTAARPTAPLPLPPPSPSPSASPMPSLPAGSCASFEAWPDVDGVTCNGCTALVLTASYGGRCDAYCGSFGHVCVAAGEEEAETCQVQYNAACDQEIASTSDMLCTCRLPDVTETTTSALTTLRPPPSTGALCSSFDVWPSVDNGVTCNSCTALVLTSPFGSRCDLYCESFGHVCVAAAEEDDETCDVKFNVRCDEDVGANIGTTSDMLCTCHLPSAASSTSSTTTTPATTTSPSPSFSPTSSTTTTPATTTSPSPSFEPVDGGEGRACRGASATDNSANYFILFSGVPTIEGCMAKCVAEPSCKGIEHTPSGRCEVWTRPEGIQASIAFSGFTCLAYGVTTTASTRSVTTTLSTSVTSTASLPSWNFYQGINCYNGFGATSLSNPPGTFTVAACKAECLLRSECQGVVMRSGFADGTSPCWLVGDVNVNECQDYPDYNLWHRRA